MPTPRPQSTFERLLTDHLPELQDLMNMHGIEAVLEVLQLVSRAEYPRL